MSWEISNREDDRGIGEARFEGGRWTRWSNRKSRREKNTSISIWEMEVNLEEGSLELGRHDRVRSRLDQVSSSPSSNFFSPIIH